MLCEENHGKVHNVTVKDGKVNCESDEGVGGLITQNYGCVTNCNIADSKIISRKEAGGFIEHNQGVVQSCIFNGVVKGRNNVGGITSLNDSEISNCSIENSKILAKGEFIEGEFTIKIGGITGRNSKDLTKCTVEDSEITGGFEIGGIVGYNTGNIIQTLIENSKVHGNIKIGGITGRNIGNIKNSGVFKGSVDGNNNYGGLCGKLENPGTCIDSITETVVKTEKSETGGLCFGKILEESIAENCAYFGKETKQDNCIGTDESIQREKDKIIDCSDLDKEEILTLYTIR